MWAYRASVLARVSKRIESPARIASSSKLVTSAHPPSLDLSVIASLPSFTFFIILTISTSFVFTEPNVPN